MQVEQSRLKEFLTVAEGLGIKGLCEDSKQSSGQYSGSGSAYLILWSLDPDSIFSHFGFELGKYDILMVNT